MLKNSPGAKQDAPHIWQPFFAAQSPLFFPLTHLSGQFNQLSDWPTCQMFNRLAQINLIKNAANIPIEFVPQFEKSDIFEEQYEPRTYLQGHIQTREQHWHDFFNAMVWLNFPKTKAEINAQQYFSLKSRQGIPSNRIPIENVLTLFDENGAIILSSDPELTQLLQEFQWHELFWQRRHEVMSKMRFVIFGHSIYEKALQPYIGMTASSIIFNVPSEVLVQNPIELLAAIDNKTQTFLASGAVSATKKFFPLPVLGVPGWYQENEVQEFYNNTDYFRLVRKAII